MTSSPGGRRSPAANGNGYESPTEEVQNVLFSSQPSGATTPIRPSLVSRASHMVAMHPTGHTGRTNSSGLNDILAQTEKQVPNGKVSIKDRIACHQWTYFTMVRTLSRLSDSPFFLLSVISDTIHHRPWQLEAWPMFYTHVRTHLPDAIFKCIY